MYGAGTQIFLVVQMTTITVINIAGYFFLNSSSHYSPVATIILI